MIYFCIYNNSHNFEWDEQKNKLNIQKHGYNFNDVQKVFDKRHVTSESFGNYGEQRYLTIGVFDKAAVVVIHVMRGTAIRIISFRRANRKERRILLSWLL